MTDIILFFAHLALLVVAIYKGGFFATSGLDVFERMFFFLLKVLFGFSLIFVYTKYYPQRNLADVFKYFDDAAIIWNNAREQGTGFFQMIYNLVHHSPATDLLVKSTHHYDKKGGGFLEANHHFIIYVHLLLRAISNGNIFIHSLWFSFFSFTGSVGIYRAFQKHFTDVNGIFKCIVFLVPSVLFWASGMLKESLVFLFLGLLFSALQRFNKWTAYRRAAVMSIALWFLKPFIVLCLLAATFSYYSIKRRGSKPAALFVLILLIIPVIQNANHLLQKRNEFITLSGSMKAGSILDTQVHPLDGIVELIKITPASIYAVLMEPSVFHIKSFTDVPFCAENILILLAVLIILIRYFRLNREQLPISSALFVFGITQLLIIGWTVPVAGAIVRYKVTALPFVLIAILFHVNLQKIKYDFGKR